MRQSLLFIACFIALVLGVQAATADDQRHWVGTWATAPQLVETQNNPPSPGLAGNSLRQIVQVSLGGDVVRLKLTNTFSTAASI